MTVLWILVSGLHVGVPLTYFTLMGRLGSRRSYGIKVDSAEQPNVTVLIPTYNEASVMGEKLRNIAQGDYPTDKIEIVIVDGGSSDNTAEIARNLLKVNGLRGTVLEERERTGKSTGLNLGLKYASGDLVCISDAECTWDKAALRNAVKYFADPSVGSVSGIHGTSQSQTTLTEDVESSYRSIYRRLRIAESKIQSTPIAEGEIQVFRREQFTGFDPKVGGDDTCAALCMVEKGFRAISAEDVLFYEPVPLDWRPRFSQKIRRGQHVLQAFLKHKGIVRRRGFFSRVIFPMEFFLYAINPVLFVPFLVLTIWATVSNLPVLLAASAGLIVTLASSPVRRLAATYISNNITMLGALVQETRGEKQLTWKKIVENRRGITLGQGPEQR